MALQRGMTSLYDAVVRALRYVVRAGRSASEPEPLNRTSDPETAETADNSEPARGSEDESGSDRSTHPMEGDQPPHFLRTGSEL